jgi:RimJ/RimL family protein N-acetyltransferase
MPILTDDVSVRETERLRLEPIRESHLDDYFTVFTDDAVAEWYAGKPTREEARADVARLARAWSVVGVHKWLAYERNSGDVVGRGGLSSIPVDSGSGHAIVELLGSTPWLKESIDDGAGNRLARNWLEIGWALRGEFWGRGYASEIGRAGLEFAFGDLGARAVVAFTERVNQRSQSVMERIGMKYVGEFPGEGFIEGEPGVHPDAPFVLYSMMRPA